MNPGVDLEVRIAVLEAQHVLLGKAVEAGFEIRDATFGEAIKALGDDVRWIRNLLVGTVLLGILVGIVGLLLGKL